MHQTKKPGGCVKNIIILGRHLLIESGMQGSALVDFVALIKENIKVGLDINILKIFRNI